MNILVKESHLSYPGWPMVAMAFLANLITFGPIYSFSVVLSHFLLNSAGVEQVRPRHSAFLVCLTIYLPSFADR